MSEWRNVRDYRTGKTSQRRNVISWRAGNLKDTKSFKNRKVRPTRARIDSAQYNLYIASDEWADRRVTYFAKYRRACRVCGNPNVDLHHLTYRRLGMEQDRDLMPLCQRHHQEVHAKHKRYGGSLARATWKVYDKHRRDKST